jgi:hypothetical protein
LPTPATTPFTIRARKGPSGLEQQQHHGREHQESPDTVREHTIDALGPRRAVGTRHLHRAVHDRVDACVPAGDELLIEIASCCSGAPPQFGRQLAQRRRHGGKVVRNGVIER